MTPASRVINAAPEGSTLPQRDGRAGTFPPHLSCNTGTSFIPPYRKDRNSRTAHCAPVLSLGPFISLLKSLDERTGSWTGKGRVHEPETCFHAADE